MRFESKLNNKKILRAALRSFIHHLDSYIVNSTQMTFKALVWAYIKGCFLMSMDGIEPSFFIMYKYYLYQSQTGLIKS